MRNFISEGRRQLRPQPTDVGRPLVPCPGAMEGKSLCGSRCLVCLWRRSRTVRNDVFHVVERKRTDGNTYSYAVEGVAKAPRFSLGPVVGADIYLFSSVALQLEYSYRLGVDAPYRAHYTEGGSGRTTDYHGQMHRHALTVGLKLTFPFLWTCDDGYGLLMVY